MVEKSQPKEVHSPEPPQKIDSKEEELSGVHELVKKASMTTACSEAETP